jgi:hypothetical protein
MTAAGPYDRVGPVRTDGRRAGYAVAAVVNAVLLYVATHLLIWGVPAFLTDDFARVLPLLALSLTATIVVNLAWMVHDGPAFKALTQAGLSALSFAVTARLLDVFPFAFGGSDVDWALVMRVVLIIALVGTAISVVVELVRFVRAVARGSSP